MDVKDVKKVAVVGAGTMGPGLAQVFACAGHAVSLYSRSEATLEKGDVRRRRQHADVRRGTASSARDDVAAALARITTTQSLAEAGADASLVIESIAENLEAKTRRVR